jgi:hypothetical protein
MRGFREPPFFAFLETESEIRQAAKTPKWKRGSDLWLGRFCDLRPQVTTKRKTLVTKRNSCLGKELRSPPRP